MLLGKGCRKRRGGGAEGSFALCVFLSLRISQHQTGVGRGALYSEDSHTLEGQKGVGCLKYLNEGPVTSVQLQRLPREGERVGETGGKEA